MIAFVPSSFISTVAFQTAFDGIQMSFEKISPPRAQSLNRSFAAMPYSPKFSILILVTCLLISHLPHIIIGEDEAIPIPVIVPDRSGIEMDSALIGDVIQVLCEGQPPV